jgi:cation:H+ antiporter
MVFGFLAVGIVLLWVGSEAAMRGMAAVLKPFGLPPAFAGLVVAALALCGPVLAVALLASAQGRPEIALGDVVGSVATVTLLVFGLGALLRPIPAPPRVVFRDGAVLIVATCVLAAIIQGDMMTVPMGVLLLAGWLAYLGLAFVADLRLPPHSAAAHGNAPLRGEAYGAGAGFLLIVLGIVALVFGARFVVVCAQAIPRDFHFPVGAIALTLIALSTSVPALVTLAAAPESTNLAAGRLMATATFTVFLVLGLVALLYPVAIPASLSGYGSAAAVLGAVLLVVLFVAGWRLSRFHGLLLLAGYGAYLASILLRGGLPRQG